MAFATPPAYMGFIGYLKVDNGDPVPALSSDLKLTQEITKPDIIDGSYDKKFWQLGPQIVRGGLEVPATQEASSAAKVLFSKACQRSQQGVLQRGVNIDVAYSWGPNQAFIYENCFVNEFRLTATQSDIVRISSDLIGERRVPSNWTFDQRDNSRIVTWNDVFITIGGKDEGTFANGEYIRNFEFTLNNNVDLFFTFNGSFQPQDIAAKKRDIDGNFVVMGRLDGLGQDAKANVEKCTAEGNIVMGWNSCEGTSTRSGLTINFPNVIYRIEEISLTTDVLETTVQWHSLPNESDVVCEGIS